MTLADLKAEALAQVDQLRRERDEARAERDAYKRAKEENDERFLRERDEARAEVARLRAALKAWLDADDASGIVRDVAERQRDACAARAWDWMHGSPLFYQRADQAVRATPLVTEGEK